jgi:hypothetical protein
LRHADASSVAIVLDNSKVASARKPTLQHNALDVAKLAAQRACS